MRFVGDEPMPESLPHLRSRCRRCGTELSEEESLAVDQAGIDPYCSLYCSEIDNGAPMPYEQIGMIDLLNREWKIRP